MYLLLILAAFLLAVCFALNKIYQNHAGATLKSGFLYNTLLGLVATLIFFALNGFKFEITPFSFVLATVFTVLVVAYTLLGFKILSDGSVAVYSIFLMSGGMIIPYIYGILFLDEEFSPLRTVGLAVLIFAVVLSNFKEGGARIKTSKLFMCIGVFILNGFVGIISKLHQIETIHTKVSTEAFVMLSEIGKFLFGGIALIVICIIERKESIKFREGHNITNEMQENHEVSAEYESNGKALLLKKAKILIPIIVAAAAVDGISYFLQLKGATDLPATVLFPTITGASMVFSTLADVLVFREKPSKCVIISAALSFLGTLMFL